MKNISLFLARNFTELHCTALHCTALHCTALHCIALRCTALRCAALHCAVLYCVVLCCTSSQVKQQNYLGNVSFISVQILCPVKSPYLRMLLCKDLQYQKLCCCVLFFLFLVYLSVIWRSIALGFSMLDDIRVLLYDPSNRATSILLVPSSVQ